MLLYFIIATSFTWRHFVVSSCVTSIYAIIIERLTAKFFFDSLTLSIVVLLDALISLTLFYIGIRACWHWDNSAARKKVQTLGVFGDVTEEIIMTAYALKAHYKKMNPSNESILLQTADTYLRKTGMTAEEAEKKAKDLLSSAYELCFTNGETTMHYNSNTRITKRNAFEETLTDLVIQLIAHTMLSSGNTFDNLTIHILLNNRKTILGLAKLISVTKRNYYRYKNPALSSNSVDDDIDIFDPSYLQTPESDRYYNDVLTMYIFDAQLRNSDIPKRKLIAVILIIFVSFTNNLITIQGLVEDELFSNYYDGYDHGYEIGYDNGYDVGSGNGKQDQYNRGYNAGYDGGYNDGYDHGYEIGYDNGYDDGYDIG